MGQLLATLNKRKVGSLPSNTVQNPKKDGHCMLMTIRSGKIIYDIVLISDIGVDNNDGKALDYIDTEKDDEADRPTIAPNQVEITRGSRESEPKAAKPSPIIPSPPLPFLQSLKKKVGDRKFQKFISILKELSMNIHLVEALQQILGYAKFIKYLITKKQTITVELDNFNNCSTIVTKSLVE